MQKRGSGLEVADVIVQTEKKKSHFSKGILLFILLYYLAGEGSDGDQLNQTGFLVMLFLASITG